MTDFINELQKLDEDYIFITSEAVAFNGESTNILALFLDLGTQMITEMAREGMTLEEKKVWIDRIAEDLKFGVTKMSERQVDEN